MNWEHEITEIEQENEFIDTIKIYEEIIIGTLLEKGEDLSNYARTFFKEKNFQGEVVEMIEKINTHDLRIEYKDFIAQIDFVVITTKYIYIIECKNLIGDINIESEKDIETHFDELEEILNKIDYPPIISYDYHVFGGNINHIREYVGQVKNSILLNR